METKQRPRKGLNYSTRARLGLARGYRDQDSSIAPWVVGRREWEAARAGRPCQKEDGDARTSRAKRRAQKQRKGLEEAVGTGTTHAASRWSTLVQAGDAPEERGWQGQQPAQSERLGRVFSGQQSDKDRKDTGGEKARIVGSNNRATTANELEARKNRRRNRRCNERLWWGTK